MFYDNPQATEGLGSNMFYGRRICSMAIEHVALPALEVSSETTNGLIHPYFLALEIIIKVMMFFNGIVTTLAF